MPLNDWQFWIVTVLMVFGLWMLIRAISPVRKPSGEGEASCGHCASGSAASKRRRVALTIEKRRI